MPLKIRCGFILCDNRIIIGGQNANQKYCGPECRKAQEQVRRTVGKSITTVKDDTK